MTLCRECGKTYRTQSMQCVYCGTYAPREEFYMRPFVFKLITGEEIVADVVKIETLSAAGRTEIKVFEVRWPMKVRLDAHGQIDIVSWIVGERESGQLYPIRFEHILFYLEEIDELLEEIYSNFLGQRRKDNIGSAS